MSQQNKTTLQSAINTQLADNTSGDISAADVRDNLINMTDSLLFNSGSQGITGSLTVTGGVTGSLQGTATSASYAATASIANVAAKISTTNLGGSGTYYPLIASSLSGEVNLYSVPNAYKYDLGIDQLIISSVSASAGFTGSLQGTSTSSSFAISASRAISASFASIVPQAFISASAAASGFGSGGDIDTIVGNEGTGSEAYNVRTLAFANADVNQVNPTAAIVTVVSTSFATTSSYALTAETLLGSVPSASYAATASLSQTTLGAGNAGNTNGGEIQIRGSIVGGTGGENTYDPAFSYNFASSGLNIGDPNTTGGYGSGIYYLAVGYDALAAGFSVAFGSSSYAQGEGTFTHGQEVTATAAYSHAEGYSTVALGQFSHAEGYDTTTSGNNSHAEGGNTTAVGLSSHAEGTLTTSQGSYSHAEGQNTIALGQASHAEGLGTIASGSFQHVQGQYNTQGDNRSLMIVGNGTFSQRSDAFKVRMSGSIVLPTTQSTAPSWTGTDGEMVFATVTGNHFFYVWMAGQWRSGSLS